VGIEDIASRCRTALQKMVVFYVEHGCLGQRIVEIYALLLYCSPLPLIISLGFIAVDCHCARIVFVLYKHDHGVLSVESCARLAQPRSCEHR
jgi:hypothetical protein